MIQHQQNAKTEAYFELPQRHRLLSRLRKQGDFINI